MNMLKQLKRVLFTSGLTKEQYKLMEHKLHEDNRKRLETVCYLVFAFLSVMLVLSMMIESISRSRTVYGVTAVASLLLVVLARLGKRHHYWSTQGIYLFTILAFSFGIIQSIVTAPEEQTGTFLALILAIPFWFGMMPIRMIGCVVLFTGIFVALVYRVKTGYVQTADIVNSVVYTLLSIIISTYSTCSKAKRFYAEYLTEQMSHGDMLTGMKNRNAYTEFTESCRNRELPGQLTFICMDVNELKIVNDMLGHPAGDELLRGAAECIRRVFGTHAVCYRTGGDEFVVVGELSKEKLEDLCSSFDREVGSWKGSWERPLRISYGCAAAYELPEGDLASLMRLADSRLYEAKRRYYTTKGIDRRGHQEAYSTLCESYIKILKVNLTEDSCKPIRTEVDDPVPGEGPGSFSSWMKQFGASGSVHQSDLSEYREKTDVTFLRNYFRSGKTNIHIFYRRMTGGQFKPVMAELMIAKDYTHENQSVLLCVKNISR